MNPKPPHHRGGHQVNARKLTTLALANPATICWRCARTLDQHPPHKTGRPPRWTAGHPDPTADDEQRERFNHHPNVARWAGMAAEASTCNFGHGARLRNQRASLNVTRRW